MSRFSSRPPASNRASWLAGPLGCAAAAGLTGCSLLGGIASGTSGRQSVRPAAATELTTREMQQVHADPLLPPKPSTDVAAHASAAGGHRSATGLPAGTALGLNPRDPSIAVPPNGGLRFDPPIALVTAEDAIVRVVLPGSTCTGTLIDDDLVLTAHHCVVERLANGGFSPTLVDARSIQVELGGDYLAWGRVSAKAVVAPPCGAAGGGGDLAIVVLTRKLVGVPTLPVRLANAPKIGEELDVVGFGRCATSMGIRRMKRSGSAVRALTYETIHLAAAVCPGDSGGPVVTRGSGEVVGVVSLSAMDGDESTRAPSVMARLDAYRAVFAQARMVADGAAPNELPPLACP
jgi:V8-like Glu-specific endopeptidase